VTVDAPKVTLGKTTETLVVPSPLAAVVLARDQKDLEADEGLFLALGAQALVECWPHDRAWPCQPRPRLWRPGIRPEDLGRDVFDALCRSGLPVSVVGRAAGVAYYWANRAILTEAEVSAAREPSGPPPPGA